MIRPLYIFQVVTAPMSIINAIAVEAYKKYILVALIRNGQVSLVYLEITPVMFPMHYILNSIFIVR